MEVDDSAWRFVVAGVSALVVIGSVIWSSRKTESMMAGSPQRAAAPVAGS